MTKFEDLGLRPEILTAIAELGYETPMPVQEQVIPFMLEQSGDLVALAQTGTGKTAAFSIPIIQKLAQAESKQKVRDIKALILTPTRELAIQIEEYLLDYGKYLNLRHTVIYGGVPQNPQVRALRQGVDILTATPGRLLDLINQNNKELEILTSYLPKQLDIEEIENIVKDIIKESGATSMKDMGIVMKTAKEKIGASADGKTISDVVKKLLS
jgi:ATP-dependent RNA helicase RhlE